MKLKHIANFLRIINLHKKEKEIKKTFKFQPIIDNTYQNYEEFKKFCLDAGILKIKNDNFNLTRLGENILENTQGNYLDVKQEELLIEECFLSGNLSKIVLPLLAEFHKDKSHLWFPKNEIVDICLNPKILPFLYEVKLLQKKDKKIFINGKFTDKIQKLSIGFPKGKISQKQIDDSLKIMKKIGNFAEQVVLEYERERLFKKNHVREAENVEQISQDFANAGYDIRSFNGKSEELHHDRFIEVKGSTNSEFSIHWSKNETEVAKKYPDNYWIYFIPKIDLIKQTFDTPILIPNPIKNILENKDYNITVESLYITKN